MKASPVQMTQPTISTKPGWGSKWLRVLVLSLVSAGIGGNSYWALQNSLKQDSQTEEITSLHGELNKNKDVVKELNGLLQSERSTNEYQARQMITLGTELENSRGAIQGLTVKVNTLNGELSSRVTLDQIKNVVKKVAPSTLRVEGVVTNPFTGETMPTFGSGVIIKILDGRRYILTNGHVIEGTEIKKNAQGDPVYHIRLYNGNDYEKSVEFDASVVLLSNGNRAFSSFYEDDLALLDIPPDVKLPENLGVTLRDLKQNPLSTGEPIIAIGNPFGEHDSVSFGIISHTRREVPINKEHFVQTDAPINPGNSGGGSFDMQGNLVGITKMGIGNGTGVSQMIPVERIEKAFKNWGIALR